MKNLTKIIVVLTASVFLGAITYGIYDTINYKDHLYGVSTVEKELSNRYMLGLHQKERKICDKFLKYGCLEGSIINYIQDGGYLYIYYSPYIEYSTSDQKIIYNVFGPYDSRIIDDVKKIPNLIKIDIVHGIREFHHSSEIEKINIGDRGIFEKLIRNRLD